MTGAARRCRRDTETIMEVLYRRCAGLAVHKQSVVACVRITNNGAPTQEVRSFATTTSGLLGLADWLDRCGVEQVAMEATGVYSKPVWHVLEGHFQLILANAAHVKNVPGRKTDVNDAMWLADLLAHGLIRGSFVPDQQTQEMRDPGLRRGRLCCAPASSWCGRPAAISSGCKRHSKMPTSSSTRSSPM